MLSLLASLAIVFAFAFVASALLDARSLDWRRLAFAAWLGIAAGYVAALLLLVPSVEAMPSTDWRAFRLVALPFQLVATMAAIVVLELLFASPRAPRGPSLPSNPFTALGRRLAQARRFLQVTRIVARHGMAPLLGLHGDGVDARDTAELARRARSAIEEAGGVFVKLGQLLASRPDLIPPVAAAELGRLHASVTPLPGAGVRAALEARLGRPWDEVFASFDEEPLGSASIAQAHAAVLRDGRAVVVKVRRPGLETVVARDLAIARRLAATAQRRTAWGRALNVAELAEEFAVTLEDELDFRSEAKHLRELAATMEDEPAVHVPDVVDELTREDVLVMERLAGRTLAKVPRSQRPDDARALADALCGSQVRAMLSGERFHGDPHPGNVLLLDDGRLGLIDVGLSSRLDAFERAATHQLLLALQQRSSGLLLEAMLRIGAFDPEVHDPDTIERALARFLAVHLAPGLPPPEAMTELLRLTTRLGLRLPASTVSMFRALSTLAGTLEDLSPGYPIVDVMSRLGGDEATRRFMPDSVATWAKQEWSELGPILHRAPRQLDRLAQQVLHGRLSARVRAFADPDDRRWIERLVDRAVTAGLAIGTGIVAVMLLNVADDPILPLAGVGAYELLGWGGLLLATTLLFRVLLAVVRAEREGGSTPG